MLKGIDRKRAKVLPFRERERERESGTHNKTYRREFVMK